MKVREIPLPVFVRLAAEQMKNLPVMVTLFGKPYARITKCSEEEIKKYMEDKENEGKPKFYFTPQGIKMCVKHNVMFPLCDCGKEI
jgi:hypothetical protein